MPGWFGVARLSGGGEGRNCYLGNAQIGFYNGASLTLQNVKIFAIRDVAPPIFSMAVVVVYEWSFSGPVVLLTGTTTSRPLQ